MVARAGHQVHLGAGASDGRHCSRLGDGDVDVVGSVEDQQGAVTEATDRGLGVEARELRAPGAEITREPRAT